MTCQTEQISECNPQGEETDVSTLYHAATRVTLLILRGRWGITQTYAVDFFVHPLVHSEVNQ